METNQILLEIITRELELAKDQAWFVPSKIERPMDDRLYVLLKEEYSKVGLVFTVIDSNGKEVSVVNLETIFSIELQRTDNAAEGTRINASDLARVTMALNSGYAMNMRWEHGLAIERVNSNYTNLTVKESNSSNLVHRFRTTFVTLRTYSYRKDGLYYDNIPKINFL